MTRPRTTCMMHAVRHSRLFLGVVALASGSLLGCPKSSVHGDAGAGGEGGPGAGPIAAGAFDEGAVARAEDSRRAKDVSPEIRTSHDVAARRRSARALSRIADAASVEGLAAHLADEDPETMTWAAYGLGYACKGHEDAHVKMLAARTASVPSPDAGTGNAARGVAELEPRTAIARALGRCGGTLAEQALLALLKAGGAWHAPALLGLGDLATRRKQIGQGAMTALLDVTSSDRPGADMAFYAL